MQFRHISYTLCVLASLAACSSGGGGTGGGGGGGDALPVINEDGVVLSANGSAITLETNDGDVTVDLDTAYDRGAFTGAADIDGGGEGQILAFSEGDSTIASFVLTRDSGASAETYFARTVASESLPSGTATLNGTYVGAIIEDPDVTRSYISGNASIDVDLGDLTISGSVTDLTSELFGSGQQEALDNDIILPEATILANGTFAASADRDIIDPEGEQDTSINTDWSGLLGGATLGDLEAVGAITTVTETTPNGGSTITETQTGVFSVNND